MKRIVSITIVFALALTMVFMPAVKTINADEEWYRLVYDSNGGYGTMNSIVVVDGQDYYFPECKFEKPEGKTFDHWKMTGVDGIFIPGSDVKIASNCVLDGRIVVTAYWKEASPATIINDVKARTLVYNGEFQDLVTAGTAQDGIIKYVLGTDSTTAPKTGWSEKIPQETKVGTYYVWYKAAGDKDHSDSEAKCCVSEIKENPNNTVKDNTLSVKGKTVKVKYKKLKQKAQKIKVKKTIKFLNRGQGKVTYKIIKVKKTKFKKFFKLNKKTGKLIIKKKLKKGKYRLKIKVSAAGNSDYKTASKTVTVNVKVK